MYSLHKYYFYQCINCGNWYYSAHEIKRKRCIRCFRSFQFSKSTKFSKKCSLHDAIEVLKQLKMKEESEGLSGFINLSGKLNLRQNKFIHGND